MRNLKGIMLADLLGIVIPLFNPNFIKQAPFLHDLVKRFGAMCIFRKAFLPP